MRNAGHPPGLLVWVQRGTVTFYKTVRQIPIKRNEICPITPLLRVSGNTCPRKDVYVSICNSLNCDCRKHPNCPSAGECVGTVTWIRFHSIVSERYQGLRTVRFRLYDILESQNCRDRGQISGNQELGEKEGVWGQRSVKELCEGSEIVYILVVETVIQLYIFFRAQN